MSEGHSARQKNPRVKLVRVGLVLVRFGSRFGFIFVLVTNGSPTMHRGRISYAVNPVWWWCG